MSPKELLKNLIKLRKAQEFVALHDSFFKRKIDSVDSDILRGIANIVDQQQTFIQFISKLPTCNDCFNKECNVKPKLGESVRYNCPLHISEKGVKNV